MTNKMTKTVTDANTTKLNNLIFYPLEAVSCYPQLQVSENNSYLCGLRPNIYKSWWLNTHFIYNNCELPVNFLIKQIIIDYSHA